MLPRYLSLHIQLSKLREISMPIYTFTDWDEIINKNENRIASSILRASTLRLYNVEDGNDRFSDGPPPTPEYIYSMLPLYIKHLEIPLDNVKCIKTVLERCQHLISVHFTFYYYYDCSRLQSAVVEWLSENSINSTYKLLGMSVVVWIGKKKTVTDEVRKKNS